MTYNNIPSQRQLDISRLLFVQTYGYGEEYDSAQTIRSGNYWELFYTEKGLVNISSPSFAHTLSKTELFFRPPSEAVQIHLNSPVPADFAAIGFVCGTSDSPIPPPADSSAIQTDAVPDRLSAGLFPADITQRKLIRNIITEAASSCATEPYAAGQAALLYLQLLLISLFRNTGDVASAPVSRSRQLACSDDLFRSIICYMEKHISDRLTIQQICHDHFIGRAALQKLFAENTGCGVIDYFSLMKINAAKQLMRKEDLNFSRIAELLGYNSVHYFSRQFKIITGMTPTEYAAGLPGRQPL